MPRLAKEFHAPRLEAYAIAANHLKLSAEDDSLSYAQREERLYIAKKLDREAKYFKYKYNVES